MAVLDAFDLTGKTAVVTGGNTGLGEAFAKAPRERSEAVALEISPSGNRAIAVDVDVTDPAQVESMPEEVTERLGPVDILVNNAACAITGRPPKCRARSGTKSSTLTSTGCGTAPRRWEGA